VAPVLKKKRYLLLVLAPIFIALVALSPFLLSSPSALNFFVSTVNKKISGSISIDSWLIGWQQGVLCQNVVYSNPEKGISIAIPSLTSNRGLLELILAPKNFGTVHVDSPVVELSRSAVETFFVQGKPAPPETELNRRLSRDEIPVWDQVFVELKSRGGEVKIDWGDQAITIALENVSVDSTLAAGIVTFEFGFHAMEQGFVAATGSLNLPAHEYGWLETIIAETEVKVSSLQLRELLRAGAVVSKLPQGEGVANADFKLKVVGLDTVEYSGLAELTDLTLNGGFLGDDHPSFQKVHFAVEEGRWTRRGWSVKGLELVSDTLNINASGEMFPETMQLSAQGILNLPVLFDQVPRLLRVNESTFVESGIVDFSVNLGSTPNPNMKIKAKASRIGGIYKNKRFAWDSPVALFFNGEKRGSEIEVSALQFDAPFAQAKGSGGLHSFVMEAVLDLDKAFADIGMLFQLDLSGSGKMDMTMKSGLAERARFKVDAGLNISDLMLRRHDQSIIPLNQFSLNGSLQAPNTFVDQRNGELDIQIVLSSWLGEVFLVMNGEKTGDRPFKGYYTTDSELDLGQITTLLHTFNILDNETRVAGAMQLQAAGFVGEPPVEIRDLSAEITKFILEGNGALLNEPRITLKLMQPVNEEVPFLTVRELKIAEGREKFFRNGAGLNLVDFSARNIILHNVQLETKSVTAAVDRLVIPDWRKPYDSIRSQFSISADLEKMTEGFQAVGLLSRDMSFFGSTQASFLLAEKDKSNQEMKINVHVAGFGMKRRNKTLIGSEDIVFSSLFQGQMPLGAMTVEELKLRSGILDLDVTGSVSRSDAVQLLELSGSMKPDLYKVASIISKEFDIDLKMQGQPDEQIVIKYPLWSKPGDNIGQLGVFSSFHADRLVYNGIDLRNVALPFHFDNSKLHMELSSQMNEGRLELVADIDFVADPAVIKTPENSQVMTGVKLNDSLSSILLSRIHPLFGGLAQPSGLIDVRLDSLWWPIGEEGKNEANFVAIFDAREINLESGIQLKNILTIFGLEKEKLQLQDNEIYCIGNNGRIKCSPLRVMAGSAEIVMGGFVSMDGSLDYMVEVPITKKLVSDKEYQVLKGTTIKVAVKGTTEEPSFDKETVISTIQSLMKQAAGEIVRKTTGQNKPL
jgi:hypothetical protein